MVYTISVLANFGSAVEQPEAVHFQAGMHCAMAPLRVALRAGCNVQKQPSFTILELGNACGNPVLICMHKPFQSESLQQGGQVMWKKFQEAESAGGMNKPWTRHNERLAILYHITAQEDTHHDSQDMLERQDN